MKWNVHDNRPALAPQDETGGIVTLDGVEVRGVFEFDTDEGWILAYCKNCPAGRGRKHLDPANREQGHAVHLEGVVDYWLPELA